MRNWRLWWSPPRLHLPCYKGVLAPIPETESKDPPASNRDSSASSRSLSAVVGDPARPRSFGRHRVTGGQCRLLEDHHHRPPLFRLFMREPRFGQGRTHCPPSMFSFELASLFARVFRIEVTLCPACGGRMKLIAALTEPPSLPRIGEGLPGNEKHNLTRREWENEPDSIPSGPARLCGGAVADLRRGGHRRLYCPAWVASHDRILSDPEWLESLNREQRIIMRSYEHAYQNAKPPNEDLPLFLNRETGLDHDPDLYREHVVLSHRKRLMAAEMVGSGRECSDEQSLRRARRRVAIYRKLRYISICTSSHGKPSGCFGRSIPAVRRH